MAGFTPELGLCCFTAFATLILIIATGSSSWAAFSISCGSPQCTVSANFGMFVYCTSTPIGNICGSFPTSESWLSACQFFAVISCLLAIPTCFYMFLVAAKVKIPCPLSEAKAAMVVAIILAIVTFCEMLCFAIFAGEFNANSGGIANLSWGFALMIIAFIFFAGITVGYVMIKVRGAPASGGSASASTGGDKTAAETAA